MSLLHLLAEIPNDFGASVSVVQGGMIDMDFAEQRLVLYDGQTIVRQQAGGDGSQDMGGQLCVSDFLVAVHAAPANQSLGDKALPEQFGDHGLGTGCSQIQVCHNRNPFQAPDRLVQFLIQLCTNGG